MIIFSISVIQVLCITNTMLKLKSSIEVVVELYNKREMLTVLSNYIGNCLCL